MKFAPEIYRKLAVFLIVTSFSIGSYGQKMYVGGKIGQMDIDHYNNHLFGGISFDYQPEGIPNINLHYEVLFARDYFHMPIGGPLLLKWGIKANFENLDSGEWRWGLGILLGVLGVCIPEGVGYSIPVSKSFELEPYIRPLQLEYRGNSNSDEELVLFGGGSIGTQLNFLLFDKNNRISPYVDYKIHYYRHLHPGISYGIKISANVL